MRTLHRVKVPSERPELSPRQVVVLKDILRSPNAKPVVVIDTYNNRRRVRIYSRADRVPWYPAQFSYWTERSVRNEPHIDWSRVEFRSA